MPDDNLFPNQSGSPEGHSPGNGTEPTGGSPGNGTDPGGETPLTLAQAAELITQANQPQLEKIEALTQAVANVVNRLQSPSTNAGPTKGSMDDGEDFLTRFSTDPEGAIRDISVRTIQEAAPLVSTLINSSVSNFVSQEQSKIDREFGSGAWDKFFNKPLNTIMNSYREHNAAALANHETITREVDGLKGRQFNDLVKFREESKKAEAEAEQGQNKQLLDGVLKQVQTNLTGGIRRIPTDDEPVTEDLKGYLAERTAAIGGDEDPKGFLQRTNYGNTLEDFLKHQEAMKKKEGGS